MATFYDWIRHGAARTLSGLGTLLHAPEYGISEAIDDPNRAFYDTSTGGTGGTGQSYTPTGQTSATILPGYDGSGLSYPGGAYSNSGTTEPDRSPLISDIQTRLGRLNNIYSSLFGGVDRLAQDRRNTLESVYGQNLNDLNTSFGKSSQEIPSVYGARGLGQSSYVRNAADEAIQTYQRSLDQLNQDEQNKLGQIGQFVNSSKGTLQAGQQQLGGIDLNALDYNGLQSLQNQLGSKEADLNSQLSGLGTNSDFISSLNSVAPTQQLGTQQLAKQLQDLITASAPAFAKRAIAKGLVKSNQVTGPDAQNYWQQYFENLLTQNGQANPLP